MDVIVAADEAGGIGKAGGIPWQLRKDMAHFVQKTTAVEDAKKVRRKHRYRKWVSKQ